MWCTIPVGALSSALVRGLAPALVAGASGIWGVSCLPTAGVCTSPGFVSLVVQVESGFQLEMYSVRAQTLHRNSTFSPAGIGRKSRLKSVMYSINARNVAYVSTGNRDTGVQVSETPGLDHHPQNGRVVRRSTKAQVFS